MSVVPRDRRVRQVVHRYIQRLRDALYAHPTLRHVATLLTGTVVAQGLVLLLSVPLARLYGPSDYGLFTLFQSVVSAGVAIAALRYDLAIMLPKSEHAALSLMRLATFGAATVGLLISLACVFLQDWIASVFGSSLLARWLIISGIVVFVMAQITSVQYWLNRHLRYKDIARNRITQSVAVALFQLIGAFWFRNLSGLVLGLVVGQIFALGILLVRNPVVFKPVPSDAPSMMEMASRYKKMPLLNGPNAIFDAVRLNGINMLLARMAVSGLGQFNLAWRMTYGPVVMIQSAVGQVFLKRMSVAEPGQMLPLVRGAMKRIGLVTFPVFVLIAALGPAVFSFVFGEEWREAGEFARALCPWLFMNTMTSPLSNLFIVIEKQQYLLAFSAVYCVVPLTLIYFTHWTMIETVMMLSLTMAVLLICMIALGLLTASQFDRRGKAQ